VASLQTCWKSTAYLPRILLLPARKWLLVN